MGKFEEKLTEISNKFAQSIVLSIISGAFMMIMPLTIVGSFASLFKGIEIEAYKSFIQSIGLYNVFGDIYQWTVGLLALYIVFCVGYQYASKHDMKMQAITVGLTALLCFFIITPYTRPVGAYDPATLTTSWLGSSGMFMAIVMGFIVGGVYQFCMKHHIEIKLPEQVPPNIARQFSAILPALFAVIIASLVNVIFAMTPFGNAQDALYAIVKIPLGLAGASIIGQVVLTIFVYMFWFFGIHGGMAVLPISMVLFTSAQMENLAAYQAGLELPNWITGSALSYGSGSLPLIVALLIWSKAKQNRTISELAVVPAFFGVDEPAYFGIPMIMNPIFFVPWVIITPLLAHVGTYILQAIGLLGYATGASAGGFVPFFVSNFVGYGVRGLIWGTILFVICVLVYIPFVRVWDKQCLANETTSAESEQN